MSKRDLDKKKTNTRLREALQRLIDKVPTDRELKKRSNVKVNALTVQQEAGVSVGALRHHPDISILIAEYKGNKIKASSSSPDIADSDFVKLQIKVDALTKRVNKLKASLENETKLKEEYRAKSEYLGQINQELLEEEHQLIQALLNKVPLEDRHSLFQKYDSGLKVVSIDKNKNKT
jgi:hypothetical protein